MAPLTVDLRCGDALTILRVLPDECARTCVTSPPYFHLRSYEDHPAQVGREKTPEEYIARLVSIFREVRRVLTLDGTLWLVLDDSYTRGGPHFGEKNRGKNATNRGSKTALYRGILPGLKPKDLIGIPWRTALALRDDGWFLRADIIWEIPDCMPASAKDRPTRSHEYIFLLSRSEIYYFDETAAVEPASPRRRRGYPEVRHLRSVWSVPLRRTVRKVAHTAAFPLALAERCISIGSRSGDTILDPFLGSATSAEAALALGRHAIGIELVEQYLDEGRSRLAARAATLGVTLRWTGEEEVA